MKYGHFDDILREYVITQPNTPLPWNHDFRGDQNYCQRERPGDLR